MAVLGGGEINREDSSESEALRVRCTEKSKLALNMLVPGRWRVSIEGAGDTAARTGQEPLGSQG